jgi:uncharacterized protein YbjT (DUF2867 family)
VVPWHRDPVTTDGRLALVTGVTGYIGAQLVPRLRADGWRVRVLTRDADRLRDAPWADDVEVVVGDAAERAVLDEATSGVDAAWFLIHSMSGARDYAARDRDIAESFGESCWANGVSRIVYLGGLYPSHAKLSRHLVSRREVGDILLSSGVPTTVLQAGIVVGVGSVSYDLLRTMAEALPALVAPDWIDHLVQPISIDDALHYLIAAADLPADVSRAFDIGGPDALSYRDLLHVYAEEAGLRRRPIVTVPVLMPRATALAAGIVAPVPTTLVSALVASLAHDMVCRENDIAEHLPEPAEGRLTFRDSVARALESPDEPGDGPADVEDVRTVDTSLPAGELWRAVEAIGGSSAAYPFAPLWWARGTVDRVLGGPGFAMGREDGALDRGDLVDFWTVDRVVPGRSVRLRPRMKIPGRTLVDLSVEPTEAGSRLVIRTSFRPHGAIGMAYWYGFLPGHVVLFQRWAERLASSAR